jgi:hypothetical protein
MRDSTNRDEKGHLSGSSVSGAICTPRELQSSSSAVLLSNFRQAAKPSMSSKTSVRSRILNPGDASLRIVKLVRTDQKRRSQTYVSRLMAAEGVDGHLLILKVAQDSMFEWPWCSDDTIQIENWSRQGATPTAFSFSLSLDAALLPWLNLVCGTPSDFHLA